MVRYGNVVYYDLGNHKVINLTKSHAIFDKNRENRFFDFITSKDSIGLKIDGEVVYFEQKSRREPKDLKNIAFYSRRFLRNENVKIKYLEIKEIRENIIVAEGTMKYKSRNRGRKKLLVKIDIADLDGVFIGPGENQRTATFILSWAGGLAAGIYVNSR